MGNAPNRGTTTADSVRPTVPHKCPVQELPIATARSRSLPDHTRRTENPIQDRTTPTACHPGPVPNRDKTMKHIFREPHRLSTGQATGLRTAQDQRLLRAAAETQLASQADCSTQTLPVHRLPFSKNKHGCAPAVCRTAPLDATLRTDLHKGVALPQQSRVINHFPRSRDNGFHTANDDGHETRARQGRDTSCQTSHASIAGSKSAPTQSAPRL